MSFANAEPGYVHGTHPSMPNSASTTETQQAIRQGLPALPAGGAAGAQGLQQALCTRVQGGGITIVRILLRGRALEQGRPVRR